MAPKYERIIQDGVPDEYAKARKLLPVMSDEQRKAALDAAVEKVEQYGDPFDEYPKLGNAEVLFAEAFLATGSAVTAFEEVYATRHRALANRLLNHPDIQKYIEIRRAEIRKTSGYDLVTHVEMCKEIRDKAISKGQFSAAIAAEMAVARALNISIDAEGENAKSPITIIVNGVVAQPKVIDGGNAAVIDVTPGAARVQLPVAESEVDPFALDACPKVNVIGATGAKA